MNLADIQNLIHAAAARHGISPNWLHAIVGGESGFKTNALSPKGAMGLGQLMPGTARELGVTNPYDPGQNIEGSATYLARLRDQFGGNLSQATAAYNWGPGNVSKYGMAAAPPETKNYLATIARLSNTPGLATGQVMQGQMPDGTPAAPAVQAPPAAPAPMVNTPEEVAAGQPPPAQNNRLSSLIADVQKATPGVTAQPAALTANAAGWAADLSLQDILKNWPGKVYPPEVHERFMQLMSPGQMQPITPPAAPVPKRPSTSDLIS